MTALEDVAARAPDSEISEIPGLDAARARYLHRLVDDAARTGSLSPAWHTLIGAALAPNPAGDRARLAAVSTAIEAVRRAMPPAALTLPADAFDRLATIGGPGETRSPAEVLAAIEHELDAIEAALAPGVRDAAAAESWEQIGRHIEALRGGDLDRRAPLHREIDRSRTILGVPPPRKRFGFADALVDRPPPPSVCPKLEWEVGRVPMIVGAPGAGKTMIMQAAILDMIVGRPLWGCPDFRVPRCCRVLFVDLDQGANKTLRRFKRLLCGMGVTADDPEEARRQLAAVCRLEAEDLGTFDVDEGEGLRLGSLEAEELARWRAAWIAAVAGYDVAPVDSLRRLAPFLDENDSRFSVVPDVLRMVSEATGCVILLLHHASNKGRPDRKPGGAPSVAGTRGSSAIDGAAGTQLVIEEDDTGRRVTQTRAGEAVKLTPFYLAFEDGPATSDAPRGLRVVYKTDEQINIPLKSAKSAKIRALADKCFEYVRKVNATESRGVSGKKAIVTSVDGRDGDLYAAVQLLIDEKRLDERPAASAGGKKYFGFWAVETPRRAAPASANESDDA